MFNFIHKVSLQPNFRSDFGAFPRQGPSKLEIQAWKMLPYLDLLAYQKMITQKWCTKRFDVHVVFYYDPLRVLTLTRLTNFAIQSHLSHFKLFPTSMNPPFRNEFKGSYRNVTSMNLKCRIDIWTD